MKFASDPTTYHVPQPLPVSPPSRSPSALTHAKNSERRRHSEQKSEKRRLERRWRGVLNKHEFKSWWSDSADPLAARLVTVLQDAHRGRACPAATLRCSLGAATSLLARAIRTFVDSVEDDLA